MVNSYRIGFVHNGPGIEVFRVLRPELVGPFVSDRLIGRRRSEWLRGGWFHVFPSIAHRFWHRRAIAWASAAKDLAVVPAEKAKQKDVNLPPVKEAGSSAPVL